MIARAAGVAFAAALLFGIAAAPQREALASASAKPSASYTTQQAEAGRFDYIQSCAECHGGKLEGVFGPALAGGDGNLQWQSVKDVYVYITAHMPHGNPETLPDDQYLAIMAFLMQAHGMPAGSKPLTGATVAKDATLMGPR